MVRNWTAAQSAAITAGGADILVSAAAGSGKTTALTERIIRRIRGGGDIERMLIVTFSRAAAADMKEKISRALKEASAAEPDDLHLARQCAALTGASISTIHSFCFSLLRRSYGELSLSPRMRVADESEAKFLRREIMNDTIDALFSQKVENAPDGFDFAALADTLAGGSGDESMTELLLGLYSRMSCFAERHGLLYDSARELENAAASGGIYATRYGAPLLLRIARALDYYIEIMSSACRELADGGVFEAKYLPSFSYSLESVRKMKEALDGGDHKTLAAELSAYAPPRLSAVRGEKPPLVTFFTAKRTELGKFVKGAYESCFSVPRERERRMLIKTAEVCRDTAFVLDEFTARYDAEKRSRAIFDYADLEHYALRLLRDGGAARSVASEYDEIYIDEYQDVNSVQDEIFSAVSVNNRFMVGDVKQSIYGFRGSDPTVFDGYRRRYADIMKRGAGSAGAEDAEGISVFMSENFRCDETIIDFVNRVCGRLMRCGNVSYDENDDLRFAKPAAESEEKTPSVPVRVLLASAEENTDENAGGDHDESESVSTGVSTGEEAPSFTSAEAAMIADEILRLCRSCRRRDGAAIRPGDIAVLLRSAKNRAPDIEKALRARGIPTENDAKQSFFESPEILLMLCLLNAADNPLRDIYLAGALRSPVFAFTLDELVRLRLSEDAGKPLYGLVRERAEAEDDGADDILTKKCRDAVSLLGSWRSQAQRLGADEILRLIYRDTGIESLIWSEANRESEQTPPELRAENLDLLYEYARSFEASGYRGLHRFLAYINGMIEDGASVAAPHTGRDSGGAVRIMTVHQSKGLEFPVVFAAGCAGRRNESDMRPTALFCRGVGTAAKLRAGENSSVMLDTLPRRAVAAAISDAGAAEEMRILYVALTRAQERLYVTAGMHDPLSTAEKCRAEARFLSPHTVYTSKTYIEWILTALYASGDGKSDGKSDGDENGDEKSDGKSFEIKFISSKRDPAPEETPEETPEAAPQAAQEAADTGAESGSESESESITNSIIKRMEYSYPYKRLGSLPAKISVSKLYPDVLDENEEGDDSVFIGPKEGGDSDAARAGTATHLFMQFCDFERADGGDGAIRAEIDRLVSRGFISADDAALINTEQISRFLSSDIYAKMKDAAEIWREQRFNIRLPADEFTENAADKELYRGEELLVQGVIDCFFIDSGGDVTVVDYKTDRLTEYELSFPAAAERKLRERHTQQLTYYARALSRMFGKPPGHVYIYSLPLGDTVEVFI